MGQFSTVDVYIIPIFRMNTEVLNRLWNLLEEQPHVDIAFRGVEHHVLVDALHD